VVHSTALNSSDNLHSYPPDNHHSSDDVYWRGGRDEIATLAMTYKQASCCCDGRLYCDVNFNYRLKIVHVRHVTIIYAT